jgi:hypothetical protein
LQLRDWDTTNLSRKFHRPPEAGHDFQQWMIQLRELAITTKRIKPPLPPSALIGTDENLKSAGLNN